MSKNGSTQVREQLARLSGECDDLCDQYGWSGAGGVPNFRLLYSSVTSFEVGSSCLFLGVNPGGGPDDAKQSEHERPFEEPGYSAYLDDVWGEVDRGQQPARGQHGMQRTVQEIAMVLAGVDLRTVLGARSDRRSVPEKRIGRAAVEFLRSSPSGNIIPFRGAKIGGLPSRLTTEGERIGWELCAIARPAPRVIVALANQLNDRPLRTLRKHSDHRGKADYQVLVHERMRRMYREVVLPSGPLAGARVVGLPAVVRDRGRDDVTEALLRVLFARMPVIHAPADGRAGQ